MLKSSVELAPKDFLCGICKQYLSAAPIYLLEDDRDICNSCSQVNYPKPYRNTALEKVLANVHFPCKNRDDGCTVTYKFNKEEEHISRCNFNPVCCPLHHKFKCQWSGKFKEMREHVTKEHRSSILNSATFDIYVDQDAEDTFMVLNGECFFMVNYVYDSAPGTFKYIIATFDLEPNSKIKLENSSNRDNVVHLKGHKCVSLNSRLIDCVPNEIVNLHEIRRLLNNCTSMSISLTVEMQSDDTDLVQSKILPFFKCSCNQSLKLPIFELDDKFICHTCYLSSERQDDCQLVSFDSNIARLLAQENYVCQFKHCGKVVKGEFILNHENHCVFNTCTCNLCLELDFRGTYLYGKVKEHYTSVHEEYYFPDVISVNLKKSDNTQVWCYTFVEDEIVLTSFEFIDDHFILFKLHLDCILIKECLINVEVQCSNENCTTATELKFQSCLISQQGKLDLPPCFRDSCTIKCYVTYCA